MAGAGRRGHSLRRQDVWDANKMEFTNNKDATRWIKPTFRKGWEVK